MGKQQNTEDGKPSVESMVLGLEVALELMPASFASCVTLKALWFFCAFVPTHQREGWGLKTLSPTTVVRVG